MKTFDRVKVFPHGSPEKAAEATVMIISTNGRSIAVMFDDKPPFVVDKSGGMMIHRELFGLVMMATREELDGKPWGPWVELMGGGHYEIEAL